ncbi:hypothetical protein LEP1GSC124_0189, partial [Leptospira interrogans serovar Pyrogenes str. 200701872]
MLYWDDAEGRLNTEAETNRKKKNQNFKSYEWRLGISAEKNQSKNEIKNQDSTQNNSSEN